MRLAAVLSAIPARAVLLETAVVDSATAGVMTGIVGLVVIQRMEAVQPFHPRCPRRFPTRPLPPAVTVVPATRAPLLQFPANPPSHLGTKPRTTIPHSPWVYLFHQRPQEWLLCPPRSHSSRLCPDHRVRPLHKYLPQAPSQRNRSRRAAIAGSLATAVHRMGTLAPVRCLANVAVQAASVATLQLTV